jgi:hypothetical protein
MLEVSGFSFVAFTVASASPLRKKHTFWMIGRSVRIDPIDGMTHEPEPVSLGD